MNTPKKSPRSAALTRRTLMRSSLPVLLGLCGVSGLALAEERSAMDKIRERGVLKVALYKDNAPYSDGKNENMTGLDAQLRWRNIPWYTDANEGLKAARAEKRPVLLWVTGDNPLGRC